ncbi:hypothetical protein ATCC90586_003796 [Pythium insidiosum]|nr:hypothetical protein ATCC90586_003796 [Pythium insidiosum]
MTLRLSPLDASAAADVARVIAMEAASYPADEAADAAKIRFRLQQAPAFFRVARLRGDDGALVGFVNGTLSTEQTLTEHAMSTHDARGELLCIHSVVIDSAHRRRGLATKMLTAYVQYVVHECPQVRRIALIAKTPLVAFYVQCGFRVTRLSPVCHGQDPWFEFELDCDSLRRLPVVQVDAFSARVFDGNPAAVVVMPAKQFHADGVTKWMQDVAKENNLSETAYVARREDSTDAIASYDLRWFTPAVEVSLCGHATLASAFVLYEDRHVADTAVIHFHTLSGVLVCKMETHDGANWVQMDFPLKDLEPVPSGFDAATLALGLELEPSDFLSVKITQTNDVLVHVSTAKFAAMKPNFETLCKTDARGIIVTSAVERNEKGVDFQSRFFGPGSGVPEDPVTGSAHCALAKFWSNLLGKSTLYAHQACPFRGGYVSIELPQDRPDRVLLKGEAVIALRGELLTSP